MSNTANFWAPADPNESSEKRVSKFKQWFNRSRIGELTKDRRYHEKALTKRLVRKEALKREEYRDAREKNKFYM